MSVPEVTTDTKAAPAQAAPPVSVPDGVLAQTATAPVAAPEQTIAAKPDEKFVMPKGLAAELHNLREDRRQLKEALEKAERAREAAIMRPTPAPTIEEPSFIDDPEKRLAIERERITNHVLSTVRNDTAAAIQAQRLQEQGAKAIDYILTQPEINGDMTKYREIDEIIAIDPELSQVVKVAPLVAGKAAVDIWRKSKGLGTVKAEAAASAVTAMSGPKPASAAPTSNRTIADIKADLKRLNPHDPAYTVKWESLAKELSSIGGK